MTHSTSTKTSKFFIYTLLIVIFIGLAVGIYLLQNTQKVAPSASNTPIPGTQRKPPSSYVIRDRSTGKHEPISVTDYQWMKNYFAEGYGLSGDELDKEVEQFFIKEAALREYLQSQGKPYELLSFEDTEEALPPDERLALYQKRKADVEDELVKKRSGYVFTLRFDNPTLPEDETKVQVQTLIDGYRQRVADGENLEVMMNEFNADETVIKLNMGNRGNYGARHFDDITKDTLLWDDTHLKEVFFSQPLNQVSPVETLRYKKTVGDRELTPFALFFVYPDRQVGSVQVNSYNDWMSRQSANLRLEPVREF